MTDEAERDTLRARVADLERPGYGEAICRRCDVQAAFCPCEKPDVAAPPTGVTIPDE